MKNFDNVFIDDLFDKIEMSDDQYRELMNGQAFYNKDFTNNEIQVVEKFEFNKNLIAILKSGASVEITKPKEITFLKKQFGKDHLSDDEFIQCIIGCELTSDIPIVYKNNYWSFRHGLKEYTLDELEYQWKCPEKKIYNCKIIDRNPGGFIVDLNSIECFLSGENSGFLDIKRFDEHIGKTLDVVVINKSIDFGTFVVSATEANKITQFKTLNENNLESAIELSKDLNKQAQELSYLQRLKEKGDLYKPEKIERLKELEETPQMPREVITGFIKNITSKGVFVTIDTNDTVGFLNPNNTMNPLYKFYFDRKYLHIGEPIKVVIAEVYDNKKILLSNLERETWED